MTTTQIPMFIALAVAFVVFMVQPVYGGAEVLLQLESNEMLVNDTAEYLAEGTEPKVVGGRALVPIRAVIEALGGIVVWDSQYMLITVRDHIGENEIILKINSYDSVVNAEQGPQLDVAPILVEGTTMAPIYFVSRHLGYDLSWGEDTRTIEIRSEF